MSKISFDKNALVTVMQLNENGFTLIEVLVAVAVIGIISSIAFPIYQGYQLRAHANSALSSVKALQSPIEAQVQGIGSTVGTVGPRIELSVLPSEGTATIKAIREMGEVTFSRAGSDEWFCEHSFDIELKGCEEYPRSQNPCCQITKPGLLRNN